MKKLVHLLLVLAIALLPASCVNEAAVIRPAEDTEVLLRLSTPGSYSAPGTRALTYSGENTISDVYVLVFSQSNVLTEIKKGEGVNSNSDPNMIENGYSGWGSFMISLPATPSGQTTKLVVLANSAAILTAGGMLTQTVSGVYDYLAGSKSYDTVIGDIRAAITGKGSMFAPASGAPGTIPMWGETGQISISAGGNNDQSISLMRAVARIDVGLGRATRNAATDVWTWNGLEQPDNTTAIPFELTHLYVFKANKNFMLIPATANRGSGVVTAPTLSLSGGVQSQFTLTEAQATGDTGYFYTDLTASGTAGRSGWFTRSVYVPEADIHVGGTTAIPGDVNHTNRMAIVIGGKYGGATTSTYYRLDFAQNGNLIDVLRNHLYQFNIASVTGPGYNTPELAYTQQTMNINARIYDWELTATDNAFIDGARHISLSASRNKNLRREAVLYHNAASTDEITFETNIPLSDFALTLSGGGTFTDLGGGELDKTEISNAYVKVKLIEDSVVSGVTYGRLVFTALGDFADGSPTQAAPAVLTIETGRIDFSVKIWQNNDSNDWDDGGNTEL